MMSPEFLKQIQKLRKEREANSQFQTWMKSNSGSPLGTWGGSPWGGQTRQVIVYDPTNGRAYPNPAAALSAGVQNFSYQIPAGMKVDWSYWDQFSQPSDPPLPPYQTVPIADQTVPHPSFPSTMPGATPGATEPPAPSPKKKFQMPDAAKRFAAAGMMGRASAAVKAVGGTWTKDMHRQLKKDADGKKNYGGDFSNQSTIDALVKKYGYMDATSGKGGKITKKVQMGKAKRDYEKKFGKGTWSKQVHVDIAASAQRAYRQNREKIPPGVEHHVIVN